MGNRVCNHLNIQDIEIIGNFWKEKQSLIREVTIPYIWEALNDNIPGVPKSGAVRNMEVAAGLAEGDFYGLVSQDSDLAKWLEAASYSLALQPNEWLDGIVDKVVELLEQAQEEDGYLNAHYSIKDLNKRWTFLRESCELYCAGHVIEAAVAHHEATGKERFLNIACKYADHIGSVFGREDHQKRGYCGHAEVELALFRLYKATGEKRYLELCAYFIQERGQQPYYFTVEKARLNDDKKIMEHLVYALEQENYIHSQSHLPIREQRHADGHSVKAMYFYCGVADLAMEYGDETLLATLRRLWNSVVNKRMFVTGGIGSAEHGEAFTFDYDLPNDINYGETCASIGLIFLAQRMLQLDHDSRYADVMERALYNGVLSGLSLKGTEFFYTNPLEMWPEACERRKDKAHLLTQRQPWFDCPCCPPNISRLIASLGQYIHTFSDNEIFTHLYMSNRAKFQISGTQLELTQMTKYPWDGLVTTTIRTDTAVQCTLGFRIPDWCKKAEVRVNGIPLISEPVKGYVLVDQVWNDGDRVELVLKMDVQKVYAHPKVRYNGGKVALQRGPVVYCFEQEDNGEILSRLAVRREGAVSARLEPDLLNGVVSLSVDGVRLVSEGDSLYSTEPPVLKDIRLKAVPYFAWCNRTPGEMTVWINER